MKMNFVKRLFKDRADVDTDPGRRRTPTSSTRRRRNPASSSASEAQPILEDSMKGGHPSSRSKNDTATTTTSDVGLVALEEQRPLSQQPEGEVNNYQAVAAAAAIANTEESNNTGPGLTDGYETWSQSFEAFHQAIFHSILYLAIGIVAYSFLLDTKWPIIDSMYFSVVIFTTVGYGDLHPYSQQGEIFTMIYALYGIVIIGIFLGVIGDLVVERQQNRRKSTMENARRKYLETFQYGTFQRGPHPPTAAVNAGNTQAREEHVTKSVFMETIQPYCNVMKEQFFSVVALIIIATPVIIMEKWGFIKGMYWMIITATTIGLGDESPTHPWSRALCILYIPVAVYSTGRFLGLIANAFVSRRDQKVEEKFFSRAMTLSDIERMDFNNDGGVSEGEFLIYMLVTLQKVNEEDIEEILHLFKKLDATGDGVLSVEDIADSVKRTGQLTGSSRNF